MTPTQAKLYISQFYSQFPKTVNKVMLSSAISTYLRNITIFLHDNGCYHIYTRDFLYNTTVTVWCTNNWCRFHKIIEKKNPNKNCYTLLRIQSMWRQFYSFYFYKYCSLLALLYELCYWRAPIDIAYIKLI